MKTKIFFSFFLLVFTAQFQQVISQWQQTSLNSGGIITLSSTGNYLFAAKRYGGSAVYFTTDGGENWINTGLNASVWGLSAFENYIYVASQQFYIYRSTNLGMNWQQIPGAADGVRTVASKDNLVFAGFQNYGTKRSTDFGETWSVLPNINGTVTSYFIDGNTIYAGQQSILRSTDTGINWITAAANTDFINQFTKTGNTLFAASESKGVFISVNNGINWQQTALTNTRVTSVVTAGSYTFAGTTNGGVKFSPDNGNTWQDFNTGLSDGIVFSLLIKDNYLYAGTYSSGVWKRDISELLGISNISNEMPSEYKLFKNYPNPFNPSTKIRFSLPHQGNTKLSVYDASGKLVKNLFNSTLNAGTYEIDFNGTDLSSGIYFYSLSSGTFTATGKMILTK